MTEVLRRTLVVRVSSQSISLPLNAHAFELGFETLRFSWLCAGSRESSIIELAQMTKTI
jgi:hypothetical protein